MGMFLNTCGEPRRIVRCRMRVDEPNARTVLVNVIESERSTSPPNMPVYMFDAPPPGAQPVATRPIAAAGSSLASLARPNAS
jgi:hypothetical protein